MSWILPSANGRSEYTLIQLRMARKSSTQFLIECAPNFFVASVLAICWSPGCIATNLTNHVIQSSGLGHPILDGFSDVSSDNLAVSGAISEGVGDGVAIDNYKSINLIRDRRKHHERKTDCQSGATLYTRDGNCESTRRRRWMEHERSREGLFGLYH